MPDDDILNVQQVAAQFSVTPQTVRSWIDGGKLKAGRVGKAYRILRRDVYAMLEDAAAERHTPDHDMWQDRAAQLQPMRQPSEPAEMWPTTGAKRAVLSRRLA
jgi:excisionase family DNA binding protein